MNQKGISVKQLTPFEYEKKKQFEENQNKLENVKQEHQKREQAILEEMQRKTSNDFNTIQPQSTLEQDENM